MLVLICENTFGPVKHVSSGIPVLSHIGEVNDHEHNRPKQYR